MSSRGIDVGRSGVLSCWPPDQFGTSWHVDHENIMGVCTSITDASQDGLHNFPCREGAPQDDDEVGRRSICRLPAEHGPNPKVQSPEVTP